MSKRFPHVVAHLVQLKRDRPELASEVDIAIGMIIGTRPNIEEKYDSLLLKLDRTYSQLEDARDQAAEVAEHSTLHLTRKMAKTRVKCMNKTLRDLMWIRARNRDLIKAAANGSIQETSEAALPPEVPQQED